MPVFEEHLSRRLLLKSTVGAIGALAGSTALARTLCGLTPAQDEGPFYPEHEQLDEDNDLTWVKNFAQRALGQVIYVQGTVRDEECKPVQGALVEIWQACASGKYNHSADTNTAPLDPNFQYWGRAVTDAEGRYLFKTIVPGAYPNDPTWTRPPHIHYKVHKRGYHELTTQLYFSGNPLNDEDKILRGIPTKERALVITDLLDAGAGYEAGSKLGSFDITIRKVV